MYRYLAHIAEDGREQTVLEHLQNTARLAASFAAPFGGEKQGELAGLAHDLGKYSAEFQRRLRGGPRVDHATAGAYECARRRQDLAAFVITGHHGGLPDGGGRTNTPDQGTYWGRINRAREGKLPAYTGWTEEISLPAPPLPSIDLAATLEIMFYIRMLYSCLVDADYLDTETFMKGKEAARNSGEPLPALEDKLCQYIAGWYPPRGELNRQRCAILDRCRDQGKQQKPGLFTLTVPTGGGKTVSSLAFALAHARANGMRRVVYVIPYTSIIEQTAKEFRDILGPENVLEHHSGVEYDTGPDGEATSENMRLLLATENWDMPIVVTTAVQFFESLYANRPAKCRKLHNLSNSVIIFDEAQMLPLPYLRPCVAAIAQLIKHYRASAVLCTATQPALERIFAEFLPNQPAMELCSPELSSWNGFRRVSFTRVGKLTWSELAGRMRALPQALCIVNSRKNAQALYVLLKGEETGTYHLSTLLYPAHRKALLEDIKKRLKAGLPCRVVSTSLIEAGVDVDFPAVFREEAGLDSILQAAGRCNREGKRKATESVVTIFQAEASPPPLFAAATGASRRTMAKYEDILSREAIFDYFRELLDLQGTAAQDQKRILELSAEALFPFSRIAEEFHLIDSPTRNVYIPLAEGAGLVKRLRDGERTSALFRQLGQYGVSIYEDHLMALYASGDVLRLDGDIYVLDHTELYSQDMGLSLKADSGKGNFI